MLDRLTELSQPRAASPDELTEREKEVLALIAKGFTNKEIAAEIVVSPFTALNHVIHVLEKLGLSRRSEAAAEAVRRELTGPPPKSG